MHKETVVYVGTIVDFDCVILGAEQWPSFWGQVECTFFQHHCNSEELLNRWFF